MVVLVQLGKPSFQFRLDQISEWCIEMIEEQQQGVLQSLGRGFFDGGNQAAVVGYGHVGAGTITPTSGRPV